MELIAERFYTNLFRSTIPIPGPNIPAGEKPPGILPSEVRIAIESMKTGAARGPDDITADFLRAKSQFTCASRKPYDDYLPSNLPKKGDQSGLRNYRPICLLSVLYKLFTNIILSRISKTLDKAPPVEQAGFPQGSCCMDHIQTVSRFTEVCREYQLPLVLIFDHYEKAFSSAETKVIPSVLVDQGVDPSYMRILSDCYGNCAAKIQPFN
ncbi:unnamed protein product [Angiostrongylus costaricensis]|uniref:Reverse transcriptase domain-containing protein n=1 Tax=Angiostrongylus costaricensis TaxID=334426 RepID=A0A0R3PKK9_ANGCS|nr:unnamed protein product [Angiostrongylus costaricensis]